MRWHGLLALVCVLVGGTISAAQDKLALPAGAVARLGVSRMGVPANIFDIAFSPDGRTFIVSFYVKIEDEPNIVLFDVGTGLERKRLDIRHAYRIVMARHKPLMALDTKKEFEVWNLATEKLVKQWPHPGPAWQTNALAISPDGTEVVAAVSQSGGKAIILRWDAATGIALPARYPTSDGGTHFHQTAKCSHPLRSAARSPCGMRQPPNNATG